jgi:ribosomal protein L16 Arg81 hydroxylase
MPELASPSTLAELLAPIAIDDFFASSWEQRPLHIPRAVPDFYDRALPSEPLARLAFEVETLGRAAEGNPLNTRGPVDVLGPSELRGVPDGAPLPKEGRIAAYERGATLRVNDAQHRSAGVRALCESLGHELAAVVGANLYVVRAGAPKVAKHVDPHDVYVMQLRGRKRWQLFEGERKLPVVAKPAFSFQRGGRDGATIGHFNHRPEEENSTPIADVTLEQGDLLYVPRGTFHLVSTLDRDSMHLTIGAWPTTLVDWLSTALLEAADRDARLRRAVPRGLLRGDACDDAARALFDAAVRAFGETADAGASRALLADSFSQLVAGLRRSDSVRRAGEIDPAAEFERDPSAGAALVVDGPRARVSAKGRTVELPGRFVPAIARALDGSRFRVAELPGDLEPAAQAQLVDRLLRLGALRPAPAASGG